MSLARSWLFVPADSERKIEKACASGADAVIIDLEDSVAVERKSFARELVRAGLPDGIGELWVRINPLTTEHAVSDLIAAMAAKPIGIMLPKAEGRSDIVHLDHYLTALEPTVRIASGTTLIHSIVTETPASLFVLDSYANASARLSAMSWGAEDLSSKLGASSSRDSGGDWAFTYQLARSLCLAGAINAGVQPIDTLWGNFRDSEGLRNDAIRAYHQGFTGKLAIHPDQVAIINAAFTPTDDEIMGAQRIVDAFAAQKNVGTVGLDGRMLDLPHLKAAQRILFTARRLT